jgi:hypothetical protein
MPLLPSPTTRLEDHPLTAVCKCLSNVYVASLHNWRLPIWGCAMSQNLRNYKDDEYMKFPVLTAASMKITVFGDVASCSLVEIGRRFARTHRLHHQRDETNDEGCKHHWNVGLFLQDHKTQHSRRPSSSNINFIGPAWSHIWFRGLSRNDFPL